ncbi:MAG: prepilin peptidase [Dehalococcoidia bacterium]|nr:prepilin peptidase [Dehalococcoidia bacterium]
MWIPALVFALGACVGSFLNVCIDRLPQGLSILKPPSHCPGCGRGLTPVDLIPILSYVALRGRCRQCGSAIPRRVLAVEVGVGALFVFLYINYGLGIGLLVAAVYISLFLLLAVTDLEQGLIPNNVVYPAVVASVIVAPFRPPIGLEGLLPYGNGAMGSLIASLGGGAVLFLVFLVIALLSRGGMGGGDIKMAALVGMAIGIANVPAALLICWVSGGFVAVLLVVLRVKGRRETIPFGPFLALGGAIALLWGDRLTGWYLTLMGVG